MIFVQYQNQSVTNSLRSGAIVATYKTAATEDTDHVESVEAPAFSMDLTPLVKGQVAGNSLSFKLAGDTYVERAGKLYRRVSSQTGSGLEAGTVDLSTGQASITSWDSGGALGFALLSGILIPQAPGQQQVSGRAASRPLKSQSLYINVVGLDGTAIAATSDADGNLTGAHVTAGKVDVDSGVYSITFDRLVDAATMRYNGVAYSYLPLDADVIGLDPVRLPSDGRVPVFRKGDYVVFGHALAAVTKTVAAGDVVSLGGTRLSRVRVVGADGGLIETGFTADLDAGTVTFSDVSGYQQPLTLVGRWEDMVRLSDAQLSGLISFTRPLSHDYSAGDVASSALILGDLYARVGVFFDQTTWGNAWSDSVTGSAAQAGYNTAEYPPAITNQGTITERWAVVFQSTTQVQVIGEHVGVVWTGPISGGVAPINPAEGVPYFSLDAAGFGQGWAAGNVIRFNTVGAQPPVWLLETVQQGTASEVQHSWELLARGDVNRN